PIAPLALRRRLARRGAAPPGRLFRSHRQCDEGAAGSRLPLALDRGAGAGERETLPPRLVPLRPALGGVRLHARSGGRSGGEDPRAGTVSAGGEVVRRLLRRADSELLVDRDAAGASGRRLEAFPRQPLLRFLRDAHGGADRARLDLL